MLNKIISYEKWAILLKNVEWINESHSKSKQHEAWPLSTENIVVVYQVVRFKLR